MAADAPPMQAGGDVDAVLHGMAIGGAQAERAGVGEALPRPVDLGDQIGQAAPRHGREALHQNLADRTRLNPPDRRTMHLLAEPLIEINGDTATAVSPYVGYGRIGDAPWEIMSVGRIHTKLVRDGEGWLFTTKGDADSLFGEALTGGQYDLLTGGELGLVLALQGIVSAVPVRGGTR